jgi:hypothetical protein
MPKPATVADTEAAITPAVPAAAVGTHLLCEQLTPSACCSIYVASTAATAQHMTAQRSIQRHSTARHGALKQGMVVRNDTLQQGMTDSAGASRVLLWLRPMLCCLQHSTVTCGWSGSC